MIFIALLLASQHGKPGNGVCSKTVLRTPPKNMRANPSAKALIPLIAPRLHLLNLVGLSTDKSREAGIHQISEQPKKPTHTISCQASMAAPKTKHCIHDGSTLGSTMLKQSATKSFSGSGGAGGSMNHQNDAYSDGLCRLVTPTGVVLIARQKDVLH
jgi:hypothetical protein